MADELTNEQKLELELAHARQQAHSLAAAILLVMHRVGLTKVEISERELLESPIFDKGLIFFDDIENKRYVIEVKEVDENSVNILGE